MRFVNCTLDEVVSKLHEERIIFFGKGSWLNIIDHTELMELASNFCYVIDNNVNAEWVRIGSYSLRLYSPQKIRSEKSCAVILTSPVYMFEMYCQLQEMNLGDEVVCYAFPFMQMVTENVINPVLLNQVVSTERGKKIPTVIHSFWFSGEEKPDSYQKCIDTWKEKLPDYQIIEWNKDNYDWHKHPFLERAIELEAWAFATDYARLDVLYEYGGIYLDMDVEIFKTFDDLLGNDAILSFSNHVSVDLAVMGSRKENPLIRQLLSTYDDVKLPLNKKEFTAFFQPSFVRETLVTNGIKMDGSLQKVENATVFPNVFFMPMDHILFKEYVKTDYTYCIHYDNFGWSFSEDNKREKKIRDNNALWKMCKKR